MKLLEQKIQQVEKKILQEHTKKEQKLLIKEMKKIGIEKLPYAYSALKKFIDSETMDFHYNKHYKGYVDKLNDALSKKNYGDVELEKIIKNISKYNQTIRNNAGGAFNHALFWNMLTPEPKKLKGPLYKKIIQQYKTFSSFKKEFETIAKDRFGSGWVWLVLAKNNRLKIMSTPNQDNPLMNVIEGGGFPLLGLDLWEHAYYLKYKNKRDEYIKNFWDVVNWDFVSKMFEMKTKTKLLESKMSSKILSEEGGVSYIQACDFEEERFFQNLIKTADIGQLYGSGIYRALKKVSWLEFKPKDLSINRMQGFYKDGIRHDLSYLAGNYRAFCMITKSVNMLLKKLGRTPIIFSNKSEKEQQIAIRKLVNILEENAEKIFDENSPFLKGIMSNLGESKLKGEKVEKLSRERLNKFFGEENVSIESGFGLESDNSGFDGKIKVDGKELTMQIKPFSTNFVEDDKMIVLTTGKILSYPQDLMVFTNSTETLVFSNKNTEAGINAYKFNPDDLIYTLK